MYSCVPHFMSADDSLGYRNYTSLVSFIRRMTFQLGIARLLIFILTSPIYQYQLRL